MNKLDLSRVPTSDLEALAVGDMSKVSTETLKYLQDAMGAPSASKEERQPISWSEVPSMAASNLLPSGAQALESMVAPIVHPFQTIDALRDVLFGGLGKVVPGAAVDGQEEKFDAVMNALKDRYGGIENIKHTLATDPVGVVMDLSSVLTGGGSAAARLPGMVGRIGREAATVGRVIEPYNMSKLITKSAVGAAIPESVPTNIYARALKPPTPNKHFNLKQQRDALQAGLDAAIYARQSGLTRLNDIIDDLNQYVEGVVSRGAKAGAQVETSRVVSALDGIYDWYHDLPEGESYLKQIDEVRDGILRHGPYLPADQAQRLKQKIYRLVGEEYGKISSVKIQAHKAIALGLKDELLRIFPEIKSANDMESVLLRLEPVIEKALGRISRRDIMGIGTPITAIAGTSVTGVPNMGAKIGLLKEIVENPTTKTFIAIALNKARKGGFGPGFVDQRIAAYLAGEINKASQEQ